MHCSPITCIAHPSHALLTHHMHCSPITCIAHPSHALLTHHMHCSPITCAAHSSHALLTHHMLLHVRCQTKHTSTPNRQQSRPNITIQRTLRLNFKLIINSSRNNASDPTFYCSIIIEHLNFPNKTAEF